MRSIFIIILLTIQAFSAFSQEYFRILEWGKTDDNSADMNPIWFKGEDYPDPESKIPYYTELIPLPDSKKLLD